MQDTVAKTAQHSANRTLLSVCYLPIEQLKPDPRNARVHDKKQVRQIASSIESFGFNVPILIDGENNVVAGHGRILAAKLLGLDEAPTVRLDHLTGAQRRAFAIADNRLTEIASWDGRLLGETLKELAIADLDFALEATGFDAGEIDLRIEALPEAERGPAEPPIPAVPGPAVTRAGDLWLLGRHKVLCGDALGAEAYRALLGSEPAIAAFTDPPYNVPVNGHVSGLGQTRHREFPMAAGEMDSAAFTKFLETSIRHMAAFSRSGAVHYVCMDWRHAAELLIASRAAGFTMLNLCVWTKPNAGMGSFYRSQHEFVFVFKAGSGRHQNNVQLGRHGRRLDACRARGCHRERPPQADHQTRGGGQTTRQRRRLGRSACDALVAGARSGERGQAASDRVRRPIGGRRAGPARNRAAHERGRAMTILSAGDLRAIMRADFYSFMTRCFAELCGGAAFLPNWHLDVVAAKLQATFEGRIRRLIINVPPRHLKSLAASAALPAWWLGHAPDAAIVCAAYAQDLPDKFARDCRALMQSSWYRATFATRLTAQRAALQELVTTKGGSRLATSVGGVSPGAAPTGSLSTAPPRDKPPRQCRPCS